MNTPAVIARVKEYRMQTAKDAQEEATRLALDSEETQTFLFSADSNAIWDAQQGRQYRKPVYTPRPLPTIVPMYDELGFLSDEEYKRLTGKERKK
jgi:hypothetical protein